MRLCGKPIAVDDFVANNTALRIIIETSQF